MWITTFMRSLVADLVARLFPSQSYAARICKAPRNSRMSINPAWRLHVSNCRYVTLLFYLRQAASWHASGNADGRRLYDQGRPITLTIFALLPAGTMPALRRLTRRARFHAAGVVAGLPLHSPVSLRLLHKQCSSTKVGPRRLGGSLCAGRTRMPRIMLSMIWHRRLDNQPAYRWLHSMPVLGYQR